VSCWKWKFLEMTELQAGKAGSITIIGLARDSCMTICRSHVVSEFVFHRNELSSLLHLFTSSTVLLFISALSPDYPA
jgi:hypothetical protein